MSYWERLFPLNRSITGDGVRRTLEILGEIADFEVVEVPTGISLFGWGVPPEWEVHEARLLAGPNLLADWEQNNLSLMGYSTSMLGTFDWVDVKQNIHVGPEQIPSAIPYRTSYYERNWGFCIPFSAVEYIGSRVRVNIDTAFKEGSMTLGYRHLPGTSGKHYLISTYSCHPSMANDNISGMLLWARLLRELSKRKLRHNYHFLIGPETLGALWYLKEQKPIDGGFVLSCVAGRGAYGYKKTFLGDSDIDTAMRCAFIDRGIEPRVFPFDVQGSDERQFASPAVRVPVGSMHKSKYYEYPEYHTSADDLSLVSDEGLHKMYDIHLAAIDALELNSRYFAMHTGEPKLSDFDLYPTTGGENHKSTSAVKWVLFGGDGETTLPELSVRSGVPLSDLNDHKCKLEQKGLIGE